MAGTFLRCCSALSHNMRWCENLEREADSALIVAGDVATDLGAIGRCLKVLLDRYDVVFAKLDAVLALCADLGVRTAPELLPCGVFIVPLLSWPHEDFDREPPLALPPGETLRRPVEPACRCISDYGACVWPGFENGSRALAARFDAMQDLAPLLELRRRAYPTVPLISFSTSCRSRAASGQHAAAAVVVGLGGPVPPRAHEPHWSAFYATRKREPTSHRMAEYVRCVYCPAAPM
ncbi:calcineurin-like phosphoesterase [Aureococcus anophagefferens]|nr:calcineurin-like phosphoesterase [Aureococcus anophagefferens]